MGLRIIGILFVLSAVMAFGAESNLLYSSAGSIMAAIDPAPRFEPVSVATVRVSENSNDRFTNFLNMAFVYVPSGSFRMGSPDTESGRDPDERQHRATLREGFYVQITEVTNRQFAEFLNRVEWANPDSEPWLETKDQDEDSRLIYAKGQYLVEPGYEDHPVVEVTWYGATAFTDWLFEKTGEVYRLPTEAEWEYFCRAGSTTRFFWGDQADCSDMMFENLSEEDEEDNNCVHYNEQHGLSVDSTAAVRNYSANAWGLYDVHGNVWEWCRDWYGPYADGGRSDPTGPASGDQRVVRGGSWEDEAKHCRSANRNAYSPEETHYNLGFRVVKSR